MPELPEVETIARILRQGDAAGSGILGMHIRDAVVYWNRTIQTPSPDQFVEQIRTQCILEIGRRGKYLLIKLTRDHLLIHLRMSGDLRVEEHMDAMGRVIPPRKHDRAALVLDENLRLSFEDTRKFGRIWLVQDVDEVVGRLGPEPLNPEFTPEIFYQHLLSFKRQLKPLLLDQTFLAGMGNIYTDEALHRAHLHPLLKADMLSEMQAAELLWAIRYVLLKGIETNGASIDWVYRGGSFQNTFQVYGRSKQACYTCGHSIEKISVGQRGTHFCPYCQPYKISQDL